MYKSPDLDILRAALAWSVDQGGHWDVTFDAAAKYYEAVEGEGPVGVFIKQ